MTQTRLQPLLYVGLGNPGPSYEMTRHNMGYLVIQALARRLGWCFKENARFNARLARGASKNCMIHLMLPLTYMNLSGEAVYRYVEDCHIPLQHLVVVSDDIALPFGQLRLRNKGSAGGHNGLKSVEVSLGTSQYKRLRMGIGHPGEKMLVNYVLEPFSPQEQEELPTFVDRGVEVLESLLNESFLWLMNRVNALRRDRKPEQAIRSESIDITKPLLTGPPSVKGGPCANKPDIDPAKPSV